MRKYASLILSLAGIKLLIQLWGNGRYGFHRDELLHLSAGEHLDWGFFEFPPFIAFIGFLADILFDHSLAGTRLFSALAGTFILIFSCLITIELGGKKKAVLLTGIAVLAFIPFYRNHTLLQPVAFDQLFWTMGFYFTVKSLKSLKPRDFLLLGLVAGFGLLNKYTMLIWGFGITVSLFFYNRAELFKSSWLYLSALVALIIFSPNILWQIQNGLPFFDHMAELSSSQLNDLQYADFVIGQLELIPTLLISMIGIGTLFFNHSLKKFRFLGIAFSVIFFIMFALKAKAYYFYAAYPMVFAAGAYQFEIWFEKKPWLFYALSTSMLVLALPYIPKMTPILPIETFVTLYDIEKENGRYQLTGDYADMFGWQEQVQLVDSVYKSFPDSIRTETVTWAENYGEAGAVQILGDAYGLPNPISRHGSFWSWGYGNPDAKRWISLGNEPEAVHDAFNNCQLVKMIFHPYAIGEENGIPLYVCTDPKVDIPAWWAAYEEYVFD